MGSSGGAHQKFSKSCSMSQIANVFLIDDSETFNYINLKTMEKAGFAKTIKTFDSGSTALAYIWKLSPSHPEKFPDMIFLDLNMPVMSGWEFLDSIKNLAGTILKNCKLFILTSSIDRADIDHSDQYTMVSDFISKPLTVKTLESLSPDAHY